MPPNTEESSLANERIAYLARSSFEDGRAYRGGALVLDGDGKPLEFRCTSPIRPNPVQRTLYGASLEPYMLVQLIGKPLLSSLRESFLLVLVNEPAFLNLRAHTTQPVLFVRRQGIALDGTTARPEQGTSLLVDSPTDVFDPVVVEAFREHAADREQARPLLESISARYDPLEPFERVLRALQKVHDEKTVDRQ